MATVACPFCYNKISQSRLAYRCMGRGAPGGSQKCTKRENETRKQVLDVTELAFPTFEVATTGLFGTPVQAPCQVCGGVTARRACPVCHSPLSATFRTSRSPLVGVVGGKGSGKSVYLSVLYHELRTSVRRRFQADIGLAGDTQGGLGSAQDWLQNYEDALFERGRLFAQTPSAAGGNRAPVVVEWRQPRRVLGRHTLATTVLSFYDAAGEDLTTEEKVHDQAYIGVANGLILLLDPWQLRHAASRIDVPADVVTGAEPPLQVLRRVTELLRNSHPRAGKRLKVPLAVVFAKMDAFFPVLGAHHPLMSRPAALPGYDEVTGLDTHEHVKALLDEYGADDIDTFLQAGYTDFRYFAVSALGAAPDYVAKTLAGGGVAPFRVEEPLLWLLHRLGVVGRSRS